MRGLAAWRGEIGFIIAGAVVLLLCGVITGYPATFLLAGAFGYFGWHVYHLSHLLRWLDDNSHPVPHDAAGIWGYIYHGMETRRRKVRRRKKQINRLLKEFSSSARALPDATIALNKELEILWINDAASRLLHVRRTDIGQPVGNFIRHPDFLKYLDASEFEEPFELVDPLKSGTSILLQLVPYGRQQFLLLGRDITEQKRIDQMRRDFIANASHELRTPLTVLQGSIELMESAVHDNPQLADTVQRMGRQSDRMRQILEDLLTLARLESKTADADFGNELAAGAFIMLILQDARAMSDKLGGHRLEVHVDTGLNVLGDEEALRAAFSNLIMNAIRYTPAGGMVSVRWRKSAGGARFEVTDTGPGIAPQHIPRLTERFYRADVGRSRETGGTGLGLSIVKHVLEHYHSSLEIQSLPGKGSTFAFTIPAAYVTRDDRAASA